MSNNIIIEVKNLAKTYHGKDGTTTNALKGVSFSVSSGSIFGIIGPNGAGKSTIIDCILGVKKVDSGTVSILGQNPQILHGKSKNAFFDKIGVQFQDSRFQDKLRVSEICELYSSFYSDSDDWQKLLNDFDLADAKKKYINDLSGGQKQKLAVILALLPHGKVVFLDELTTGLDPSARRSIWKYLKNLQQQGLTIVLTSHYMEEVEFLCDKVAILKDGVIVQEGSPKELINATNTKNLEETFLLYMEKIDE